MAEFLLSKDASWITGQVRQRAACSVAAPGGWACAPSSASPSFLRQRVSFNHFSALCRHFEVDLFVLRASPQFWKHKCSRLGLHQGKISCPGRKSLDFTILGGPLAIASESAEVSEVWLDVPRDSPCVVGRSSASTAAGRRSAVGRRKRFLTGHAGDKIFLFLSEGGLRSCTCIRLDPSMR